jgi:hypothetical protein
MHGELSSPGCEVVISWPYGNASKTMLSGESCAVMRLHVSFECTMVPLLAMIVPFCWAHA